MPHNFPQLSNDFFSVCQSAIRAAGWKYSEFDRVRAVEGELAALKKFMSEPVDEENIPEIKASDSATSKICHPAETKEPEVDKDVKNDSTPHTEPNRGQETSDKKPVSGILSPKEAAEAPKRPMPDEIKELVEGGIDVAKNPPPVRPVEVTELPSDPAAAAAAFNKPF